MVFFVSYQLFANEEKNSTPPLWAKEAIWYQIFPERFRNGDKNNDPHLDLPGWKLREWGSDWYQMDDWEILHGNIFETILERRYGGDIQGILDQLDYLQDLGITAIYLNPVFQAPSLHKYDGSTFHHIDPHFGPDPQGDLTLISMAQETDDPQTWVWTKADQLFLKLVNEVHSRGMKIIIDGVFNHSGRDFFAFKDILKNGQNSVYKDWYNILRWDSSLPDGFEYSGWWGHKNLPEFKEDDNGFHPKFFEYIKNITSRWMAPNGKMEHGVDGWRLDVAFNVQHEFWKKWRSIVKSLNPNAYITAEVWQLAPEYLKGDEFDALMNYPFAYAVSEFVIDKKNKITASNFDELLTKIQNSYSSDTVKVMQNLMSSHDTARVRSQILNPDLNYRNTSFNFPQTQIQNNHLYNLTRGNEIDQQIHKLVALIQMTFIGAPFIYYGDEIGMSGANDPDCRKPMLWSDIEFEDEKAHPLIVDGKVLEKNLIETSLLDYYKKLISIRKNSKALTKGTFSSFFINDSNDVYVFYRQWKDEKVYILINSSFEDRSVSPPVNEKVKNLMTNEMMNSIGSDGITIKAKSGIILQNN